MGLNKELIIKLKMLIFMCFVFSVSCLAGDYEAAYQEGWKNGSQEAQGVYSIAPVPPVAPIPDVYRATAGDGYNRGVLDGYKRAETNKSGNWGW